MEEYNACGFPKSPQVEKVVREIADRYEPECIYLYNHKQDLTGATSAFKLAVIGPFADREQAERDIYLDIDSEVPFDVILYTPGEWEQLCDNEKSFAHKILLTGMVMYG